MSTVDGARHAIENLLYRYASAADDRDADGVALLFREAAVDFAGQRAEGYGAVHSLFADAFRDAPPVRHLVSNVHIDLTDEVGSRTAEVRASYTRWPTSAAPGPLGLGDYAATLADDGEGWRFVRFVVRRVWTQTPRPASAA